MQGNDLIAVSRAIADRLHHGDVGVLEDILDRFGGYVRSSIARRFSKAFDALDLDDILTRALYRVWRYRERYDPQRATIATWFYLLARTSALELLRERTLPVVGKTETTPSPSFSTERRTGDSLEQKLLRLNRALGELSETDRRIVLASAQADGAGDWAAGLADELGMTAGAIRSRKLRAIEKLKTWVNPELREEDHG